MVWKSGQKDGGNDDDRKGGDKRPSDIAPDDDPSPRTQANRLRWLQAILEAFELGLKKTSVANYKCKEEGEEDEDAVAAYRLGLQFGRTSGSAGGGASGSGGQEQSSSGAVPDSFWEEDDRDGVPDEPEPTPAPAPSPPVVVPPGQTLPVVLTFAGLSCPTRETISGWPEQVPSALATGGRRLYAVFEPADRCRIYLAKWDRLRELIPGCRAKGFDPTPGGERAARLWLFDHRHYIEATLPLIVLQ